MKKIIFLFLILISQSVFGKEPVNVIFIMADGLSPGVWSAVREVSVGYQGLTNLDRMPHLAHFSNWSIDSWITDSPSAITSMMTGYKTKRGIINQDSSAIREHSAGKELETLMEYAHRMGMVTGMVTTTAIYDATPAGCYAHYFERRNYLEIARQLVDGDFTPEIIIGGGREYMRPESYIDVETGENGKRGDQRDLVSELKTRGYKYIESLEEFRKLKTTNNSKLLALFDYGDMCFEAERSDDKLGEPGLWEMVESAINILSQAPEGFFLVIEAGLIDHLAHANASDYLLLECIAFDKTVEVTLDFMTAHPNTLLLVASDHATGGPQGIGIEIEPQVMKDCGFPGPYIDANGDGFPDSLNVLNPLVIGWASSPSSFINRKKEPSSKGKHTAEDGIVYAAGKYSKFVNGYLDNTDIYNIMKLALPVEASNTGTVIALDTITDISNIKTERHTAIFVFNPVEGEQVRVEVSDMEEKILFSSDKYSIESGSAVIKWNAKKAKEELPGVFKYRSFVREKYMRGKTFIVR